MLSQMIDARAGGRGVAPGLGDDERALQRSLSEERERLGIPVRVGRMQRLGRSDVARDGARVRRDAGVAGSSSLRKSM